MQMISLVDELKACQILGGVTVEDDIINQFNNVLVHKQEWRTRQHHYMYQGVQKQTKEMYR